MHIDNLCLEVTRKCNLRCEHCLRGNAQNKTMSEEIINTFFNNIDSIGTLTIGGGEPTLAIDTIKTIYRELIYNNVTINNIFLVTNGKRIRKELLKIFSHLYNYCQDNETSGFCISNDIYHQNARGFHRNINDYTDLLFYLDDTYEAINLPEDIIYEHTSKNKPMRLLARGRAKDWGDDDKPYLDCLKLDDLDNPSVITGEMYVCYDGSVVGDINMSYLDMKKYIRGNVCNFDNLIENLKQSTIDNYKWRLHNCDYASLNHDNRIDCSEYCDVVVDQIIDRKLYL